MKGLDGKERSVVRGDIKTIASTGKSLMPDGFEMVDVIGWSHRNHSDGNRQRGREQRETSHRCESYVT